MCRYSGQLHRGPTEWVKDLSLRETRIPLSGVTTICLTQCNTLLCIELIRLLIVAPPQWLYEVAGYWQELEHAVVYANPEHPKNAQWVTCLVSMLAMQELGYFQLPGIVYRSLQHGADPQR